LISPSLWVGFPRGGVLVALAIEIVSICTKTKTKTNKQTNFFLKEKGKTVFSP
jgi:hypothetical protein